MTTYHEDAPGQPNGRFGHRDDWATWCSICTRSAEEIVADLSFYGGLT